jgi:HSP20 family protein
MKKALFIAMISLSIAGVSCAQQNSDPNQPAIDPKSREEIRRTYHEAAQEMKRLTGEFKTFYDELKTAVQEEGIADLPSDLGVDSGGNASIGRADVIDEEKDMVVHMDMPGVLKKDITVGLRGADVLEVEARRSEAEPQESVVQSERYRGAFKRSIKLPAAAAEKGFTASLENGVLTIRIPKLKPGPASSVKSIPIS